MIAFLFPQWLLDWISNLLPSVPPIVDKSLKGLAAMLIFVFVTIAKGLFTIVSAFVGLIDLGPMMVNSSVAWASLDPNIAYMLNQTGVPQGLTMLGMAYIIRLTLNLIPASLTRV